MHTRRCVQTSWLTPVELFQPWYGRAVAKYIFRHHARRKSGSPLSIVEIGGGHGTLAKNILVRTESHAVFPLYPVCCVAPYGHLRR